MLRIGVDIGGTFTDLVLVDADGAVVTLKVPSSPSDHSVAILEGLDGLLDERDPGAISDIVHGTTVATNTI